MHYLLSHLTVFLTLLSIIRDASACMHYTATFPYATSLPFEATITDNGVVTCWLSMTYDQHNSQQIAFSNHRQKPKKRQSQAQMSLTGEPDLSTAYLPTRTENQKKGGNMGKGDLDNTEEGPEWGINEEENGAGIWLPWEFKCVEGYQAHAGIGLRAVWYMAHGQEFEFVPELYEDVLRERWEYSLNLWCDM